MVHVNIPRIFLWIAVGCLGLSSSVQADEDYREVVDEAVAYRPPPSAITPRGWVPSKGGRTQNPVSPYHSSPTSTPPVNPPSPPVSNLYLPSFTLTFTLGTARRRLRKLQPVDIDELKDIATMYLEKVWVAPWWNKLGKKVKAVTVDSGSYTMSDEGPISLPFDVTVKIRKRYRSQQTPTLDDFADFLENVFRREDPYALLSLAETEYLDSAVGKIKSVDFFWVDLRYSHRNEDSQVHVIEVDEDTSEGNKDDPDVNTGTSAELSGPQIQINRGSNDAKKAGFGFTAMGLVMGAVVILTLTALFSYGYRRSTLKKANEYEISDGHDHDDDIRPIEHKSCVQMMKSRGLSDFASGSSTQSKSSYMGMFNKTWTSSKNTMSDLAAGATQEEFAENGMKIDVYGSSGKKVQKRSSNRVENKKGGELTTELEPIVEVESALSGSELSGAESWHDGDGKINKAPPLLPAMSISSAPSSDVELDVGIEDTPTLQQSPADGSVTSNPDYLFNLNALTMETPQDTVAMDGMTPYAEMADISGSPQLDNGSETKSPIVPMRCLSFSARSSTSDLDNDSDRSSSGSCVKEMLLDAINPDTSDKSSDGCVKDILEQMDSMACSREHGSEDGSDGEKEASNEEICVSASNSSRFLTEEALIELAEGGNLSQDQTADAQVCLPEKKEVNRSLGDGNNRTPITTKRRDPFLVELDTNVPVDISAEGETVQKEKIASSSDQISSPMVDIGLD